MGLVPPVLAAGDVVRIVAPSGCFDRDRFQAGLELIEKAGLRPRYDEQIFSRHRYLAGDDERRFAELATALSDTETRALWVARGGYGMTRLLHRLAPAAVRSARRWLVGFSDATALHAAWERAELASIHGANVTTLAGWSEAARQELFNLLFDPRPLTYAGEAWRAGNRVTGLLAGGNLTVLAAMAGTAGLPSFAGRVLLLEDVGERPYRLDRALTQLRQAGALAHVRAVAVGQLTDCADATGAAGLRDAILDGLGDIDVPVLAGLQFGHEPSSRAVLLGRTATLDPERATLTVEP